MRAAHIAQEQHRTHFVILNQSAAELPGQQDVSAPVGGLLVWLPVGETATKSPRAIVVIRLLPAGAATPANALDAAQVIAEFGKRLPPG